MAEFHHEDAYYPVVAANKWNEEEQEEIHEENPELGLDESQEIEYEGENSDKESDEDKGTRGILSKPYPFGAIPNQHVEQEDPTDCLCSLEEEVATIRQ